MKHPQILEDMGFAKKEIAIYMALLELDTATASELAQKTDINRVSCYDVLKILIRRGLVSKIVKNKKTYFQAGDPRRLLDYLDREQEEQHKRTEKQKQLISEVMPELLSVLNPHQTKTRVEFFEGAKGMREAYEDSLTADGYYYAYANFETMHEGLPNFFPEYYHRRVKAGISGKGIFPDNPTTRKQIQHNKQELRESIIVTNKTFNFSPEVIIYNDKVLIASWKEKIAVIIQSKELADLQKQTFELLWNALQKDPDNIVSLMD